MEMVQAMSSGGSLPPFFPFLFLSPDHEKRLPVDRMGCWTGFEGRRFVRFFFFSFFPFPSLCTERAVGRTS